MWLLDFETKSGTDIKRGYDQYFRDRHADILCMAYGDAKWSRSQAWWPGCGELPEELFDHLNEGGQIGASNAPFDQSAYEYIAVERYGFPAIKADQWYCTQAECRAAGLPSKMENAAKALGQKRRKDPRGAALIQLMSIPPFEFSESLLAEMVKYCKKDWLVMRDIYNTVPRLTARLLEDYHINEEINHHGIRIDREMAAAASQYADEERAEIAEKLEEVTGGDVLSPTQHVRFQKWLRACLIEDGKTDAVKLMARHKKTKKTIPATEDTPEIAKGEYVKRYSSDKIVRANLLLAAETMEIDPILCEGMELMNAASGAATAKFARMVALADPLDDRVRGIMRFAGAPSTLRYSSMDLQIHNMKRDVFPPNEIAHYRAQMLRGAVLSDPDTGKVLPVMETLGKLLRPAIIPAAGKLFVVGDWGAVESRKTAYLAREQTKLDVFLRGDCPYCHAAEGVYGRKISKENDPKERQVGKVLDLACGFLGAGGALASMAAQYGLYIPEEERQGLVDAWRAAHPNIVEYGNTLQIAAFAAMRNRGVWISADRVSYMFDGSSLFCLLPDGETRLRYPEARLTMAPAHWEPLDKPNPKMVPKLTALKASFTMGQEDIEWPRHGLWRGLLLENIVQATCAIMLRDQIAYWVKYIPFHVHDELVLEVPFAAADDFAAALTESMEKPPTWCSDLPLVAEIKVMSRYGK